jgi:hypothetical protein
VNLDRRWFQDHSGKSAEELKQLVGDLIDAWGHYVSFHRLGDICFDVMASRRRACPYLLAAGLYYTWHGGKVGFAHLPLPEDCEPYVYDRWVSNLVRRLRIEGGPRRFLTNGPDGYDLTFYESLPATFTVYRGCSSISPEMAGKGVCWSLNRDVAEWFALRGSYGDRQPVLMTARVTKPEVLLAATTEFEIVCQPTNPRQLKIKKRSIAHKRYRRPEMQWYPPASSIEKAAA